MQDSYTRFKESDEYQTYIAAVARQQEANTLSNTMNTLRTVEPQKLMKKMNI